MVALNDSIIREHIDQTIHSRDLQGKDKDITMKFNEEGGMMICTYFIPGTAKKFQELWIRLALPQVRKEELPSNITTM